MLLGERGTQLLAARNGAQPGLEPMTCESQVHCPANSATVSPQVDLCAAKAQKWPINLRTTTCQMCLFNVHANYGLTTEDQEGTHSHKDMPMFQRIHNFLSDTNVKTTFNNKARTRCWQFNQQWTATSTIQMHAASSRLQQRNVFLHLHIGDTNIHSCHKQMFCRNVNQSNRLPQSWCHIVQHPQNTEDGGHLHLVNPFSADPVNALHFAILV